MFARVAEMLDRRIGWHRLPVPLGLITLVGLRRRLRERNLWDAPSATRSVLPTSDDERYVFARTADGTRNDLENPAMGGAGMPFGRNVPLEFAHPENPQDVLEGPNPRQVSRELLTRDAFKPARTLNLLAAAWLQFEIRDWFSHGKGTMDEPWDLRLEGTDPWPHGPMQVPRTPETPRLPDDADSPPAFANQETHWWDASHIYGNTQAQQEVLRSGEDGKLRLGPGGSIPGDVLDRLAKEPGWWIGLALMFTLFAREHNAICEHLREEHPHWSDDDLFDHARLVNAALMAKIHTVEWTTAILGHPTLQVAMSANWWGLATERIYKLFGRISESEVISGIPGSQQNHFGIPYSLTEEFAAVYRMHPLIPDYFSFRSADTDEALRDRPLTLREVQDEHVRGLLERTPMIDLLYSFGVSHPGEITLHNFPRFLQEFRRPSHGKSTDGEVFMDLAATDILRARELGVPRYNEFRKLLGLRPIESFENLTDNPRWAEEIRHVYKDDIDRVDLMVGMFAEPKPEGFGFSDTAFRIFILMASRRLNSDRFFTTDYNARVYTQAGLDWVNYNTMSSVLVRHFPDLRPLLREVKNAFAPWPRAGLRAGRR
ncbi:MAG TPA: peroxidase family protein [Rubrobacteraceae bacterium]|nr:peroxidase family protein [Rubrobacteraceae bacterium]